MKSQLVHRARRLHRGLSAKLALMHPSFQRLLPASAPLKTLEYSGSAQSKSLIIFLPGIGDLAEDFHRQGMIDAMYSHGIIADAIAVDAHYGYYANRSIFERLTSDVIVQGREAGYEQIWLAGISLGGLGATLYAAQHAGNIEGLFLFAPYLGQDKIVDEIITAGGPRQWEPGAFAPTDHERQLWSWVKHNLAPDAATLPVYLGFGTEDRFAKANKLLAQSIPEENIVEIAGAHDWPTWNAVWRDMLPRLKDNIR